MSRTEVDPRKLRGRSRLGPLLLLTQISGALLSTFSLLASTPTGGNEEASEVMRGEKIVTFHISICIYICVQMVCLSVGINKPNKEIHDGEWNVTIMRIPLVNPSSLASSVLLYLRFADTFPWLCQRLFKNKMTCCAAFPVSASRGFFNVSVYQRQDHLFTSMWEVNMITHFPSSHRYEFKYRAVFTHLSNILTR